MRFSFPKLNKLSLNSGAPHFTRDGGIIFGAVLLFLTALAILSWDGYLFYVSVLADRQQTSGRKTAPFSENDVAEVVNLLDERQKKLEQRLLVP